TRGPPARVSRSQTAHERETQSGRSAREEVSPKMVVSLPQRRITRHRDRRLTFRLDLEALETRTLPSVTSWPGLLNPVAETEPNDTLDHSQGLGDLTRTPRAEVIGSISNDLSGAGVDWYSF